MKTDAPASPPARAVPSTTLRARRSPRWIAAGVLAMCLGGVGGATLWSQATNAQPVIRVNRTVPRGEVVQASDLAVVNVAVAPGIRTVPGTEVGRLVGQVAATDLVADSLLAPDTVGGVAVEPGTVHIGLQLAAGRLPSKPVPAGAPVTLIAVSGGKGDVEPARYDALVITAPHESPDGTWLVDISVAESQATEIAELASGNQLVLVRESER